MAAKTVLRWFLAKPDAPMVQRVLVETEEQLALRNQERLERAKRTLGGRYVLHPNNAVTRQERPRTLPARVSKPVRANLESAPETTDSARFTLVPQEGGKIGCSTTTRPPGILREAGHSPA